MTSKLPFDPPLEPMLSKPQAEVPEGDFLYEPKWDGFRALAFRSGDDVYLQSRDSKPLARYFPELLPALRAALPDPCVVDGEIVIAKGARLDFETLQLRLHPAASRIKKLAEETPAAFVAFDLIGSPDGDLRDRPQRERRALLEKAITPGPLVHLTVMTLDPAVARDWFERFEGAGLDGVIAKPAGGTYQPGKRAMIKIKHARTADCVVAGFRWHKDGVGARVGSLLLGLYDAEGQLQHVGVTSSFTMQKRAELVTLLAPLREGAMEAHPWKAWANWAEESATKRMPGGQSRWSAGKDLSWEPLRIERVAEVKYDHLEGNRFRHAATFQRWRDDKAPKDCDYAQLEVTPPFELAKIFGR
jgi:ATP-dependent DNA ligase